MREKGPLYTPQEKAKDARRKADWGESGPSFAIAQDRVIHADERAVIVLNHKGNVPKNQAEEQKRRTFT